MTPLPKKSSARVRRLLTPLLTLVTVSICSAQTVAPDKPKEAPKDEEVIVLSPFTVDATRDTGYYAENTLAGSRLRTNIGDLAAAITVVTKQQLEDTASLDINDVFRFEASTEGSSSYTPVVTDRGTIKDTVAGYTLGNDGGTTTNAQSNRVRGLGAPDAAMNFYATSNRIPFDSYNTESVEINRGPNSMLFGLGTPAGIVNQSTAKAAINKDTNTVSLRTDKNGQARGSISINRTLIKDKLSIYLAALYDNRQFERKPSYDLYRRQYGAITYRPFQKTIIRAFAENYINNANRPNFQTPRDFVTPWLQAGRPAYDPIARTITKLDTNQVYGPYALYSGSPGRDPLIPVGAAGLTSTTSPGYVTGIGIESGARPVQRIDNGNAIDYFQRQLQFYRPAYANPALTLPTPTTLGYVANDPRYAIADRQWMGSAALPIPTTTLNNLPATYGSWQNPGINNKSIYDWTKYNTLQSNFAETKARNYNFEIEQQLMDDLYLSAGWFRQKIDSSENYSIAQTTGATMQIDPNVNLITGAKNPYFGLPYMTDSAPDTFKAPENTDNYRIMLAYNLDLTKRNDWMKWIGRHQMLGMWSEQSLTRRTERWRQSWDSGDADGRLRYMPNPLTANYATNTSIISLWDITSLNRSYYLASPGDAQAKVSHSLGFWGNRGWEKPYNTDVIVLDQNTGAVGKVNMTIANHFADNGSFRFKRDLKSYNLSVQSNLLNDRLITTLGWRHDKLAIGKTNTGIFKQADGTNTVALTRAQIFDSAGYANYDVVMNRWAPDQKYKYDTKTYGAAFRPFKGWDGIEKSASEGNIFSRFVRGLTFYYNASDNWNPPNSVVTDYFRQELPTPTGEDKEIGVGFSMFDGKLVARVNWFETQNHAERTGIAGTLITRLAYGDTTLMRPWAEAVVRIRHGADPLTNASWNSNSTVDVSGGANLQEVFALMKLPVDYYAGLSPGATQESIAKGTEVTLTYNPNRNWTMKLAASKNETTFSKVAPEYDSWLATRMPVWTTAAAPEIADFTEFGGTTQYSLKNFWTSYGYSSAARASNTDGNTNAGNYFNNTVVSQVGLAKALEGAVSANQRKYGISFLTNYKFTQGKLKGWSAGGNVRWNSKGAVGYYGKAADPRAPQSINSVDITRPVFLDNGQFYLNLSVAYSRKVFSDKVKLTVQLNVDNVLENGRLDPIAVNYDGTPWAYRIIDPRNFILTTTFNF